VVVSCAGECLLCDFGLSRIRHEISRTHTTIHQGGRERFLAPEITSGTEGRINEKSDIYSLAMTIYALGTGSFPFGHIDRDAAACRMAREGKRPQKPSSLGGLTMEEIERLWSLTEIMWHHNPQRRPTVSSVRDEIMRSGLVCLELAAPIAASLSGVRPPTSLHSANKMIQQVLASGDVDPPIGDATLVLGYASCLCRLDWRLSSFTENVCKIILGKSDLGKL
jgi:serine/threonine protein kinase